MKAELILASLRKGEELEKGVVETFYSDVQKMASNPTPDNRYHLAQLIGTEAKSILDTNIDWLAKLADMRRGGVADNLEFKVPYQGMVAKIGAKGSTPEVTKVFNRKVVIPTVDLSIRPKIDFHKLAQNPEEIVRMAQESAIAMENAMAKHIQDSTYATIQALGAPNYGSGAGLDATVIDSLILPIRRVAGSVSLFGDYTQMQGFAELTGFTTTTNTKQFSDSIIDEQNENGVIGKYKGTMISTLTNRYVDDSSLGEDNLLLRDDLVYGVATPANTDLRPLKVYVGGEIRTYERTNPEDESFEMFMYLTFGSLVVGNHKYMFIYEDTNE